MKQLSIFVDESGDYGFEKNSSDYYLITLVFHDQDNKIDSYLEVLQEQLSYLSCKVDMIHTGPIIKKKDEYINMSIDERRAIMYTVLNFIRKCPILYHTVAIRKKEFNSKQRLVSKLTNELYQFMYNNLGYFLDYELINIYYDNGQQEVRNILNNVFNTNLSSIKFKRINPSNYRLFQVSDYICSIELLVIKKQFNQLATSEKKFFYLPKELQKKFIKEIRKKRLQ